MEASSGADLIYCFLLGSICVGANHEVLRSCSITSVVSKERFHWDFLVSILKTQYRIYHDVFTIVTYDPGLDDDTCKYPPVPSGPTRPGIGFILSHKQAFHLSMKPPSVPHQRLLWLQNLHRQLKLSSDQDESPR